MSCLVGRAGAPVGGEAICASWLVLGHGVVSAGGKEGTTNQAVRAKHTLARFSLRGVGKRAVSRARALASATAQGAGAPRRCPRTETLL
jgi:hypothetical protein